jgi:2-aminoethylphosphonate-pyruvate transaminase
MILLNPGPVTLTPRVRNVLAGEDLCHRESEFADMTVDILERLARVYPEASAHYEAVLLTGSGTAAVEAMLATLAPLDGHTLVVRNGVYGERMEEMLRRQSKPYTQIGSDWESPIDIKAVEQALAADSSITHVATVHHETTTARLNDIAALSEVCRTYNVKILLDAVSSFAGEVIDFATWPLEAVAATANKCLHGAPGASFVLVEKSRLAQDVSASPSLYLDLLGYYKLQRQGWSPFTQAIPAYRALLEALKEMEDLGGWSARHKRYQELSSTLRAHLLSMGIQALISEENGAAMLTAFDLPDGMGYLELHDKLKQRGFIIYAGQGKMSERIFRIANMGAIDAADWKRLFDALTDLIQE